MARAVVDPELCQGHTLCNMVAPDIFHLREEDGHSYVVVDVLNKLPFFSPWLVPLPCLAIVHHLFGTTAFRQVPLPVIGSNTVVGW